MSTLSPKLVVGEHQIIKLIINLKLTYFNANDKVVIFQKMPQYLVQVI
jgi:hypothetical protein